MKFVLDELAASTFGVEHALTKDSQGVARNMEVFFGPSKGVGGYIDVADGVTHYALKTDGPLQVERLVGPLGDSSIQVSSDLQLQGVDVDLSMRGAILDGRASIARGSADALRFRMPERDEFAASDARLKDLDLQAKEGHVKVQLASLELALLPVMIDGGSVRFERVRCEDITLAFNPRGTWEAKIGHLRAGRVAYNVQGVEGSLEDVRVDELSVLATGGRPTLHVSSLSVESAHARSQNVQSLSGAKKPEDKAMPRTPPNQEILALLDLLSGTFNVDLITSVDLPILPSWRAKHPVRITIEDGTVNYEALENSIGNLADAVLDFHVDEHVLKLDKDVPLIPFDRQTLVRWPLPERERELAERGRVRLARLTQPLVKVESNPKGKDKGVRFLEEISAKKIDVSLRVAHQESVKLPAGAALRLGAVGTPGIESLVAKGNIVYRTDESQEDGRLQLGFRRSDFGVNELVAGGHRISADVQIDTCALHTDFLDIKPAAFELSLQRGRVTSLVVMPRYDDSPDTTDVDERLDEVSAPKPSQQLSP